LKKNLNVTHNSILILNLLNNTIAKFIHLFIKFKNIKNIYDYLSQDNQEKYKI